MNYIRENKGLMLSIFKIAFPAIIEMALNTLVGIADTLMVSRLIGKEALSAAGNANQLIYTIIFVFSSFNAGAVAMISRYYGEKNFNKLNNVAGQNLSINILVGAAITVLSLLFAPFLMAMFQVTDVVYAMGLSYFRIVAYGQIFMFITFAASAALRGSGDTTTPMVITAITNAINIVGNYLLITGYGIFPKLGITGAAVSTCISRLIGATLMLYILFKGKNHLKLKLKYMFINKSILKPLWNLSSSAALEQLFMNVAFLVSGLIVTLLDTDSEASFRILLNIESLSFMPAVGISIASSTLVGKALGEKDEEKALHTGYTATGIGVAWGVLAAAIFMLFPRPILSVFTPDEKLVAISAATLFIAGFNQPLLNFMIIMSGALRGAGDTKSVMLLTSLRLWTMFVPLCYVYTILLNTGVSGMWYAEITSFFVFCYFVYRRFKGRKWAEIKI